MAEFNVPPNSTLHITKSRLCPYGNVRNIILREISVQYVERLGKLESEYEQITRNLALLFSFEEYQQFRDRRKAVLQEARTIAGSLNVPEPDWIPKS
jgi:hypothetical protein